MICLYQPIPRPALFSAKREGTSPWERVLLTRKREAGEQPAFPAVQGTAHRTCCSFTPPETSKAGLYREGSEREEGPGLQPCGRSNTVPSGLICRRSQKPSPLRTTTGLVDTADLASSSLRTSLWTPADGSRQDPGSFHS